MHFFLIYNSYVIKKFKTASEICTYIINTISVTEWKKTKILQLGKGAHKQQWKLSDFFFREHKLTRSSVELLLVIYRYPICPQSLTGTTFRARNPSLYKLNKQIQCNTFELCPSTKAAWFMCPLFKGKDRSKEVHFASHTITNEFNGLVQSCSRDDSLWTVIQLFQRWQSNQPYRPTADETTNFSLRKGYLTSLSRHWSKCCLGNEWVKRSHLWTVVFTDLNPRVSNL